MTLTEPVGDLPTSAGAHVGARLRAARRARRLSLAEVAAAAELTKGFLSRLERDQTSVSVASLVRLCAVLEVPVGSLFQAARGEVVRAAERTPINFGGDGVREFLLTPSGEKRLQAIMSVVEPGGGSGDERYALPTDIEFAFVVSGGLRIDFDEHSVELNAGDTFTFPPSLKHAFSSPIGGAGAEVLWVFSPALPDVDGADTTRPSQRPISRAQVWKKVTDDE